MHVELTTAKCGEKFLLSSFFKMHRLEAFAVVPLTWCPHIETVAELPPEGLSVHTPCGECDHVGENWVCLVCYQVRSVQHRFLLKSCQQVLFLLLQVFCSRYVAGHMVTHGQISGHNMVLSYSDLSVWCYSCDAYVHHEVSAKPIEILTFS